MLVIRLRRIGKKSKPTYRVVAAEHTVTPTGKFIMDFGFYNPHSKEKGLNTELIVEWLNKGARPSNAVAKLLSNLKVKHKSVVVVKKNKKSKQELAAEPEKSNSSSAPSEEVATEVEPEKTKEQSETTELQPDSQTN